MMSFHGLTMLASPWFPQQNTLCDQLSFMIFKCMKPIKKNKPLDFETREQEVENAD